MKKDSQTPLFSYINYYIKFIKKNLRYYKL